MGKSFQEIAENIQERIRQVAYMMWESAGRQHGMAMEYWLAAETDVLKTMQAAAERLMPSEAKEKPKPAAPVAQPLAEPVAAAPAPAVKPETAKPEIAKPETAKPETAKPQAAKPEPAKPQATKPAPRKTSSRAKAKP
ncbi:conserved hypothetical protein [uncultured Defluviicoccus sp.]|uniref:DUF2934 domain-containing protein n=1 Tax=metagenome TaxID=256318 RepID=A0A380TAH0_9ZZZZ|nr:conserved hypothetical protein [uncultured Defluviicoccus sp.]